MVGKLRKQLLGISADEASFARRGFLPGETPIQDRLERSGRSFIAGYNCGLECGGPPEISKELERIEPEYRGFAYEGAAMAFALLDGLTPWSGWRSATRTEEFIDGPGRDHIYMAHVGAGWAFARLPHLRWRSQSFLARFDPLLQWLVYDGYGFHQGYFWWRHYFLEHSAPKGLSGYAARAFDQGLGRCLWFVAAGDPARAASLIRDFPTHRHADLWSGLGLASCYAGGCGEEGLVALRGEAGQFLAHMQQGAAFGAKARERAGNPAAHTELGCQVLCGLSAADAAAITDQTLENLPHAGFASCGAAVTGVEPAYETWRVRIQGWFLSRQVPSATGPSVDGNGDRICSAGPPARDVRRSLKLERVTSAAS